MYLLFIYTLCSFDICVVLVIQDVLWFVVVSVVLFLVGIVFFLHPRTYSLRCPLV